MAGRKSKRELNTINVVNKWKFGVYCRLSSDDGDKVESNRNANQRNLIKNFVQEEKDCEIVQYYCDDGYSGTNFDRPDFKKMFGDIVSGKINTIIVKDLSRLGRNYVEVGRYIEDIFPMYKVRFISINDNIDSIKNPESITSMIVPFKNLMNDEYARDISNKVKSAYISLSKEGKFVGGTPPYGYLKNPENKYQLIINEEEAKVVKLIFNMSLKGEGRVKILTYLNNEKILCRKEMQRRKNLNIDLNDKTIISLYKWSGSTIENILTSEIYIGNLVFGRTGNASYKIKKTVYKPKSEWIIVKNTHEPIISQYIFEEIQKLMKDRLKGDRKDKNKYKQSIYASKIICGNCGRAMTKFEDNRKNNTNVYYSCRSHYLYDIDCKAHSINMKLLNKIIIESILQQIKLVMNLEKAMIRYDVEKDNKKIKLEYSDKIIFNQNEIIKYKKIRKTYYENWKFGKINQEEYMKVSSEYDKTIIKLTDEISTYKNLIDENFIKAKTQDYWIERFRRNKTIKSLSKEVVDELIEQIQIYPNKQVEVTFKYQNEYESILNIVEKRKELVK